MGARCGFCLTSSRSARLPPRPPRRRPLPSRDGIRNAYRPTFQYFLAQDTDSVQIEILDGTGKVVQHFVNSKAQELAREAEKKAQASRDSLIRAGQAEADTCVARRYVPPAPPITAGLNRFVWDGRYPGSTTFDCMIIWSASPEVGPLAPPGTYRVRLSANGVSQTQALQWRRDPRMTATEADLRRQWELGLRIRDRVTEANEAVIRIREVRAGITDRLAKANDPGLKAESDRLLPTLQEIEASPDRNRSGQDRSSRSGSTTGSRRWPERGNR
jgi:hypothetical protein